MLIFNSPSNKVTPDVLYMDQNLGILPDKFLETRLHPKNRHQHISYLLKLSILNTFLHKYMSMNCPVLISFLQIYTNPDILRNMTSHVKTVDVSDNDSYMSNLLQLFSPDSHSNNEYYCEWCFNLSGCWPFLCTTFVCIVFH